MNKSISVTSSVAVLKGVGPKLLQTLENKQIYHLRDLLFYLPYRYEDRTKLTSMQQLFSGHKVQLEGEVISSQIQFGRKRSLLCKICVAGVILGLRFYFFSKRQQAQFQPGKKIRVFGGVYQGASGYEMYHPEYILVAHNAQLPPLDDTLTPIYPALEGVSQKQWRKLLQQCFELLHAFHIEDYLQGLELAQAVEQNPLNNEAFKSPDSLKGHLQVLHFPPRGSQQSDFEDGTHPSMRYLIIEELLAHHLSRKIQLAKNDSMRAPVAPYHPQQQQFIAQLPFKLTNAQQRVCIEISEDLQAGKPMMRLLQGDVGSGKTLVAVQAALQMVKAGYQVAIMAPTEILSQQHYYTINQWLCGFEIRLAWLASSVSAAKRKALHKQLKLGEIDILIGTHAIFQEELEYARLGLVIIDEQHRFGVHQRLALLEKPASVVSSAENTPAVIETSGLPHQLIMTATPIPRTLAMSLYAGVDVSVIDELPQGRQAIDTILMPESRRDKLLSRIAQACEQGKQIYWVCSLIEQSENMDAQAVEEALTLLRKNLPKYEIAALHGKMKAQDKQAVMEAFSQAQINVLVATTVIEVGIDVPNASIIVIENAERLGLSQLHQLRGRVGRGAEKSFCVLLYSNPLSHMARQRLQVIRKHQDGFIIAEEDLRLRGAGDLFGVRQSGDLALRVADLQRDNYLLEQVAQIAQKIENEFPQRINKIINRWLPNAQEYVQV